MARVKAVSDWRQDREVDLETFVTQALQDDRSDGQVECLEDRVNNITSFLGRLTTILYDKGFIDLKQISSLLPYGNDLEEIDG